MKAHQLDFICNWIRIGLGTDIDELIVVSCDVSVGVIYKCIYEAPMN